MKERFERFTVLINKISRNIKKIKNQAMSEYGLRSTHISCLYYLYSSDSMTATDLCEKCDEDKSTISRSLDYLEHNGYLTCVTNHTKRYKSPFVLTERGKEVAQKISKKIEVILEEIGVKLTEEERNEFYRSLTFISDGLESIYDQIDKKNKCAQ